MAGPNKWKSKVGQLRDQIKAAEIAGNQKLSQKLQRNLNRIVAVPFDSKIKQINKTAQPTKPNGIDGVNRPKTLGKPEKEELDKQAGIKSRPQTVPGGPAILPNRPQSDQNERENPDEPEDAGDDIASQAAPQGQAGRPANPPQTEEAPPPEQEDDGGDGSGSTGPAIRNAVANRISDAVKKAALQASKKVAQFFLTNPYAWLIVGIMVIVLLGFLLFNYLMGTAGQSPSASGQSATQVYDPAKDRPSLQAVLQLSGDTDVQELDAWTLITGLQSELTEMKNDAGLSVRPDQEQIKGKIDAILGDIETYSVAKDAKTGKKIIDGVKELWEMFGTLPSIADAGSPLPKGSIVGYTNNLHDGTPMKPCASGKCPKGHRTFYKTEQNTCDAVDLKAKNGTPVYAAFGGRVEKKGGDGKSGQIVFIRNNAGYLAVYAHITGSTLKLHETVTTGQQIGKVGSGHLHFELAQNGKCVTTTAQDLASSKAEKKAPGYYLWQRMAKVLDNAT